MKLIEPDDDSSQLSAQPMVCANCEETFTLGEMIPGKLYGQGVQCPYCRSIKCFRRGPATN